MKWLGTEVLGDVRRLVWGFILVVVLAFVLVKVSSFSFFLEGLGFVFFIAIVFVIGWIISRK